jgi:hypothetical protein
MLTLSADAVVDVPTAGDGETGFQKEWRTELPPFDYSK